MPINLSIRFSLLVAVYLILTGCGASNIRHHHSDTNTYVSLWNTNFEGHCASAYKSRNVFIIVGKTRHGTRRPIIKVFVPDKNVFVEASVSNEFMHAECNNIDLSNVTLSSYMNKSYFVSEDFRSYFFKHIEDARILDDQDIKDNLPNIEKGQWRGIQKSDSFNVFLDGSQRVSYVSDLIEFITTVEEYKVNTAIIKREEQRAESEAKEQRRKLDVANAKARWDNRLTYPFRIGEKVCTYERNIYGFIEGSEGDRFKVYVVGKAVRLGFENGLFFSGFNVSFRVQSIEAIRWFDRGEIGPCGFSV